MAGAGTRARRGGACGASHARAYRVLIAFLNSRLTALSAALLVLLLGMAAQSSAASPSGAGSYAIATVNPDNGAGADLYAGPSAHYLTDRYAGPSSSRFLTELSARDGRGAPTTFSVLGARGDWLEVLTGSEQSGGPPGLDNRPVWVERSQVSLTRTGYAIALSLSAHRLVLRDHGRAVRSWIVGVGAPGSPTPTGRFELVEELRGAAFGPAYGAVVLGLSVEQRHGPLAGGQIAIHGTNRAASIGASVSNGCVHGTRPMVEFLRHHLPLGTPVFVRA